MGLSGLEIYKLLPKTNCKECGFATCLAFAMQLAQKKVTLDKCPTVSDAAKSALATAAEPPIRLITIGAGEKKVEIGNETVMFRHEEKFHHPTAVGFLIEDTLSEGDIKKALDEIRQLEFERVGQKLSVNLIALRGAAKSEEAFMKALSLVTGGSDLPLILLHDDAVVLKKAVEAAKDKKPLIGFCREENCAAIAELAKAHGVPVLAAADSVEALEGVVGKVTAAGVKDIVLYTGEKPIAKKLWDLTAIRRMALKKNFRALGYPTLAFSLSDDVYQTAADAATFVAKYAGIAIMKHRYPWHVLSILTVRQNIFTDPQKPLQVEPKVYQVGATSPDSPVLVTTNFSLTYYTVEAEVESSKKPSFIIACDAEGMSVLTAWAADKFTAETIAATLKKSGIQDKVTHKKIIIPGYVAVLSGKLEDESGWAVTVGPREASGLPSFLRNLNA